jgi:hypothetical protein
MVHRRILVGIFVIALFAGSAGAQESEVFAPFVSRLEVEIRNSLIRLSWKDSPDIRGPVYVYRSDLPFSARSVLPAPVEVPYGTCSYLDEAARPGVLHYFVAASDGWNQKYILFIPHTNMTSITVRPENIRGFLETPRQSRAPEGINGINASIEGNRVIISFSGADNTKKLILCRSLNPIRQQEDLLSALIIQRRISSPVVDYPLPGITYYYALLYEEDINTGLFHIRPGSNVTGPVQILFTAAGSGRLPMPELRLPSPLWERAPETSAVSPARRNSKTSIMEPVVFSEDLKTGGVGGEDYQLRTIVQGYFSLKKWDYAGEELRRFLDLPRAKLSHARARFYLGQVYYFQGRLRDALFEFLQAQDDFPGETNVWIRAVLDEFTR